MFSVSAHLDWLANIEVPLCSVAGLIELRNHVYILCGWYNWPASTRDHVIPSVRVYEDRHPFTLLWLITIDEIASRPVSLVSSAESNCLFIDTETHAWKICPPSFEVIPCSDQSSCSTYPPSALQIPTGNCTVRCFITEHVSFGSETGNPATHRITQIGLCTIGSPDHLMITQCEAILLFVDEHWSWLVFLQTESLIGSQFILIEPLSTCYDTTLSELLFIKGRQHLFLSGVDIVRVYKLTEGVDLAAAD